MQLIIVISLALVKKKNASQMCLSMFYSSKMSTEERIFPQKLLLNYYIETVI